MSIIIKISKKSSESDIRKALSPLKKKKNNKKTLADFYGKLKGVYGDGLEYQKKVRNEWD